MFAEAVCPVFASSGRAFRLRLAFIGFADDVAGGVFVGAVGAFRLLLFPFMFMLRDERSFATFPRFGFVAVLCFSPKRPRVS